MHINNLPSLSDILLEIVLILIYVYSLNFLHCRCEVNQTDYYLVKYVLYNPDYIWIKDTHSTLYFYGIDFLFIVKLLLLKSSLT